MPISSAHPDYQAVSGLWQKCRDVVGGEEEVKARGAKYLPKLEGQKTEEYDAYRKRAEFYGATGRTVQGLAGAIMRKDPIVDVPDDEFLESLGRAGESLVEMLRDAIDEVLVVGRVGYLVDAAEGNAQAYVARYAAEDVVNWREEFHAATGRTRLTMVVLREAELVPDPKDPYAYKTRTVWRILKLGNAPGFASDGKTATGEFAEREMADGFYYQEEWLEREDKGVKDEDRFEFLRRIVPRRAGGGTFPFIPFSMVNSADNDARPSKPPLLDLVNVNLSHYRTSADLEHGRHFTALPTPWAAGFKLKREPLRIGSGTAWISDDPNGKVGMLEFTGAGLAELREGMADKEKRMAVLGARLLEEQPKGVEAAATVRLRQSGEGGALANVAITVGQAFEQVIEWVLYFRGQEAEVSVQLNTDFAPEGMDPQFLTALFTALQEGSISWQTWVYNLSRGEVLPPGVTPEDEARLIAAGLPGGLGGPSPVGSDAQKEEERAAAEAAASARGGGTGPGAGGGAEG